MSRLTVFNFKECIPKLPIKYKCEAVKHWALFVFPPPSPVDSEVCISGTRSDLETQSHPLIQVKGLYSRSNGGRVSLFLQGFYRPFQV